MEKTNPGKHWPPGEGGSVSIFKVLVIIVCLPVILMLVGGVLPSVIRSSFTTSSVGAATDYLEGEGYVVFSAAQYALLAKEATAAAAVVNAEAAAVVSQATLDTLLLHNENEVYLYPNAANLTVTLTAGDGVATWGTWAEITDSGATTLSSVFAADPGYLIEIMTHDYSAADKIYMIEIAYGASKVVAGRAKIRSDWTYVQPLRSARIPAGNTIYYRMQCETANATLEADFRYYYDA